MNVLVICLHQLFIFTTAIQSKNLLLNGQEFPPSIYIPLDKSYTLECDSDRVIYWKLYLNNGTIKTIHNRLVYVLELDENRDGFYQCYTDDALFESRGVFIFSNGARSINRTWTALKVFHEDLIVTCRPTYFNDGFNEQFIALIDSQQTVRYNRSILLVKHIRSTTHLYCELHITAVCVGIRVKTLIRKGLGTWLLSDEYLQHNKYLEMSVVDHDRYRIAFEGDSVYFHCLSTSNSSIQWEFLSFNNYLTKDLPILFGDDTKINSVTIADAGLYTCRIADVIYQRVVLTIIHPPKAPDNIYERTLTFNLYSKHLICCNLDAFPYSSYAWTMIVESQNISTTWCLKRCCWLYIEYRHYQNMICTSTNLLGMTKYTVQLIIRDVDSNEETTISSYDLTDNFDLIRSATKFLDVSSSILTTAIEEHTSMDVEIAMVDYDPHSEDTYLPILTSPLTDTDIIDSDTMDEIFS